MGFAEKTLINNGDEGILIKKMDARDREWVFEKKMDDPPKGIEVSS
jgi:hypothetical protein